MAINLKDNEYYVKSGDIKTGFWSLSKDVFTNGDLALPISKLTSCIIAKDEHGVSQSGAGRIAGGILGAAILGPIGAIGGLLTGGKKRIDETIILCGLQDGRSFTAESTQLGAANLVRIAQQNGTRTDPTKLEKEKAPKVDLDQIECPQCAELIKRKAKICRFCGLNLVGDNSTGGNLKAIENGTENPINSPFHRFISDYRSQVVESAFIDNRTVIEIINEISTIRRGDPEVPIHKAQIKAAKKYDAPLLEIEKILLHLVPLSQFVAKFIERNPPGSLFGSLNADEVRRLMEVISECRLDEKAKTRDDEKEVVIREYMNKTEKSLHTGMLLRVAMQLPMTVASKKFYVINDDLIFVDADVRKQKAKKQKRAGVLGNSAAVAAILSLDEFIEWHEDNVSQDIAPESVVRLFCALREVHKLSIERSSDDYTFDMTTDILLQSWEWDENKKDATPDEWFAKNYKEALRDFNDVEENKIDNELLIATFERGFNSVE